MSSDSDTEDFSEGKRKNTKVKVGRYILNNVPEGFAESNNFSFYSHNSKGTESFNQSTSNFSEHFKSYKEKVSLSSCLKEPVKKDNRVAGQSCHNCLVF